MNCLPWLTAFIDVPDNLEEEVFSVPTLGNVTSIRLDRLGNGCSCGR